MIFKHPCSRPARPALVFFSPGPAMLLAVFMAATLSSCSNQAWYQGVQSSQERECINEQGSAYDECKRSTTQPYDEYQKERVRF
jgi:hypothetical protein